jgi:hypothetical protein
LRVGYLFAFTACNQTSTPLEPQSGGLSLSGDKSASVDVTAAASYLDGVNAKLASDGSNMRVAYAEYVTGGPTADAAGQIVFANDRQKRLTAQWVPFLGNPIRDRDDTVNHAIFLPFASTSDGIDGEPEIDASFDTWENVTCSKLDIVKHPGLPANVFPSAILPPGLLGLVGFVNNFFLADINTIGFLPGSIFDLVLGPGSANNVLGVTFTFIWVDDNGDPTDIDGNGFDDVAIKEVWYNDAFEWTNAGNDPVAYDIQTVAFHENGHALGLGHFGKVFGTLSNLRLHIAPRAAMNAFIFDALREPLGTDNAAYCGLYASWPN